MRACRELGKEDSIQIKTNLVEYVTKITFCNSFKAGKNIYT